MVTPLPSSGEGSSLQERGPEKILAPGGMILTLPPSSRSSMATHPPPDHYFSDWNQFFLLIIQFKQREGHCNVPVYHIESGKKLWLWLMVQNLHHKKRTMDSARKHLLEALGVNWNLQTISHFTWNFNFLLLLQFKQREGHFRITRFHVEDGQKLGQWICDNRTKKRAGKLESEKERRLNDIGFIWNPYEEKWDTMIRALTQFKQREGHCNVSDRHIEYLDDGAAQDRLGAWLINQRVYQGRGRLDAKREKRLESLGVEWNCKRQDITEEHFDSNFDLLLAFKEREGHVRVPIRHQESANDDLGAWLGNQQSLHRHGRLELDRQKWLEVAGVTWEKRETSG
jgi:hypothetical protein